MTMPKTTTHADLDPRIDTYHFYEREWEGYEQLLDTFEHEIPDQFNLATFLCDRWAGADPERVAVHALDADGTETRHTYGELRRDANRLAGYLADTGIDTGDRIAVSGAQKVECLLAHLAAWKLGAISVPLSLLFGPDGLEYRLADSGAKAFVVDGAALPSLREVADDRDDLETTLVVGDCSTQDDEVAFGNALDGDGAESTNVKTARTDADDPAIIMYTSGTTGPPKGVVHAHRSILGILPIHVTTLRNMDPRDDDVLYTPGEWSWIGPLYGYVLSSLYYGTAIVGDTEPGFDPERTLKIVDRFDVTSIAAPTTAYRVIMQVPRAGDRFDLSSLRVVFEGGESLGQSVVDWFEDTIEHVVVHEGYGQTEAGVFVGDSDALGISHEPGQMGKPAPGSEVAVIDPDTEERVDRGEIGELALSNRNPGCFLEFWRKPERTAEKVRNGWLLTEDLGSLTGDGYLSFHSRKDDVINSSGYRIGPAEIEECLAAHDAVADAGVIGVPDEMRGEIPKAFVVLAEGNEPSDDLSEELQAHVKSRLAKYEYPRELEFISELPKTTTGKVRRHDLRVREGLVEAE